MTATLPPPPIAAKAFIPTPHPLLPVPTIEEMEPLMRDEASMAALFKRLTEEREKLIKLSEENPYRWGFELPHWKDADELLKNVLLLIVFGGNRAGKSEYAAKRFVHNLMKYEDAVLMCLHESEETSIATQQKLIWKFLPPEIKALNGRSNPVFKVKYSQAGGFTEGKLVLPNRSELYFVSYKQDPGSFEGWELGARQESIVGAWADENMPLPWLKMLFFRLASRAGKVMWTYAPVHGLTTTIKEIVGNAARTLKSRPAELLRDRQNLPGLPIGHMPYVQQPFMAAAKVIYFHSDLNPFGKHFSQIKKLCEGQPSEFVEKRAYGYARDVGWRAFPLFGAQNVIKRENLPAVGTNFMFTDPAGARNWATMWIRVTPGAEPCYYIYRDWPSCQVFGEWAITSSNPGKFDGDAGPAQNTLGYGVGPYREMFRQEESWMPGLLAEVDPYRQRLSSTVQASNHKQTANTKLQEVICERYIDSRAASNPHITEKGGTCIADEFATPGRDARSREITCEPMVFLPASGEKSTNGLTAINDLLFWDPKKPLCAIANAPRLFVAEDCKQVLFALSNWTGLDGEKGASKDFVDLIRYMALARLHHREPGIMKTRGGGSY